MVAIFSWFAVFSKISVIFVPVAVVAMWVFEWWAYSEKRREYLWALLSIILVWISLTSIVFINTVVRNHVLSSFKRFSAFSEAAKTVVYWKDVLLLSMSSGWARFGWMNVPAPDWHAYLWWGLLGVAGGIGGVIIWQRATERKQRLQLLLLGIWCAGILFSYFRINSNRFQPQFRFAQAVIPVIVTMAAIGFQKIVQLKKRVTAQAIVITLAIILLNYNLWFVLSKIQFAYGWSI